MLFYHEWLRTLEILDDDDSVQQIFVKTVSGKTITLDVKPTDTMNDVRGAIAKKKGFSLVASGKQLEDKHTVKGLNIQKETTIHEAFSMPGGGRIVKNKQDDKKENFRTQAVNRARYAASVVEEACELRNSFEEIHKIMDIWLANPSKSAVYSWLTSRCTKAQIVSTLEEMTITNNEVVRVRAFVRGCFQGPMARLRQVGQEIAAIDEDLENTMSFRREKSRLDMAFEPADAEPKFPAPGKLTQVPSPWEVRPSSQPLGS